MKQLLRIFLLLGVGLLLKSCYYDSYVEEKFIPEPEGNEISYQNDIIPLWGECAGCHSGNQAPDLRDNVSYDELLNGYVVPGNPEASTLYKALMGIDGVPLMPPGSKWSNSEINKVYNWIDQGAKNN